MAAARSKRHNAGKNIGKLLDQEGDADDFYKTAYGGFEDTLEDGVYQSEESDDDEVDSDFDAPEQEAISDNEKEEDMEPKRKKKKIITVFKPKPSKPKDAKPKVKKRSHRSPNEFPGDTDSRTLRRSTQERSQEFKERFEEETRRRRYTKKKPKTAAKRLTQEELLAEAKRTERENLASLEAYTRLEAEKKKVKEKSHEIKGPFIRFHSVVMPLIVDINKEKNRQQTEGEEGTTKFEEKYSRNFLVFTDTKSFPHQYFPQSKPKVTKPQFCQITGLPARYIDPITKTPYATANAFKVIRNQYVSQEEQKCEKRLLQLSNWLEEKKRKKLEVA